MATLKLLLIASVLAGCKVMPRPEFWCPHTGLEAANKYIKDVTYVRWADIKEACKFRKRDREIWGCVSQYGKSAFMVIRDDLTDEGVELVMDHERCHILEYQVMGVSITDTYDHKGWLRF